MGLTKQEAGTLTSYLDSLGEGQRQPFIQRFRALPPDKQPLFIADLSKKVGQAPRQAIIDQGEAKKKELLAQDPFAEQQVRIQEDIKGRGTILGGLKESVQSKNPLVQFGGTAFKGLAAPIQAIEGAIANPVIAYGSGENDPKALLQKTISGLTGEEQGRISDFMKMANLNVSTSAKELAPEPLKPFFKPGERAFAAEAAGVGAAFKFPLGAYSAISKEWKGISKMSDKGVLEAGNRLVKSIDKAKEFVGNNLNKSFAKVDQVAVEGKKLLEAVVKLPKKVLEALEESVGNIDDLVSSGNTTLGKLREIKQFVGRLRQGSFGKDIKGVGETLDDMAVNKVYRMFKDLLKTSVTDSVGGKKAEILLALEKSFSRLTRHANRIKKVVIDSETGEATRAGDVATLLKKSGDVRIRTAFNVLRGSGKVAKKELMLAMKELEKFNRNEALWGAITMAGKALTIGGVAGAIGGQIVHKIADKD